MRHYIKKYILSKDHLYWITRIKDNGLQSLELHKGDARRSKFRCLPDSSKEFITLCAKAGRPLIPRLFKNLQLDQCTIVK